MLGIVTGLQSEAKLVAGLPHLVISGGGRADGTRQKIEALITRGVRGLVSFGIAGGLDPELRVGSLILSATVIDAAGRRYTGDAAWLQQARSVTPSAVAGPVYASDKIVESAAQKRDLFNSNAVIAADMESHHVARAAEQYGLPFIVIRTIADTAMEALPAAFGEGVDADGGTQVMPILKALMTGQLSLPAVIRAGRSAGQALSALRQGRLILQQLQA